MLIIDFSDCAISYATDDATLYEIDKDAFAVWVPNALIHEGDSVVVGENFEFIVIELSKDEEDKKLKPMVAEEFADEFDFTYEKD